MSYCTLQVSFSWKRPTLWFLILLVSPLPPTLNFHESPIYFPVLEEQVMYVIHDEHWYLDITGVTLLHPVVCMWGYLRTLFLFSAASSLGHTTFSSSLEHFGLDIVFHKPTLEILKVDWPISWPLLLREMRAPSCLWCSRRLRSGPIKQI